MNHLAKQTRTHSHNSDRVLRTEKPERPVHKVLCGNPLCVHPRSEHKATFNTETTDYQYGKCTVFECSCHSYLPEEPELSIPNDRGADHAHETPGSEADQNGIRCICGRDTTGHVRLSDGCLSQCEANWRELETLRKRLANLDQAEPVHISGF